MRKIIDNFVGKYYFLSNFYPTSVLYEGLHFNSTEAAFQAAKCPYRMAEFCGLGPAEAKLLGRRVHLRADWEEVKEQIMYDVCIAKFAQSPLLMRALLETGDAELIEGNTWGDTVWGVCNGVGENRLGKTLMRIRDELRAKPQIMQLNFPSD